MKIILFPIAILLNFGTINAQCFDDENVFTFTFSDHTYKVIKENKNWTDAAECAVSEGGYLAEINSEEEQNAIFNEIIDNGEIIESNTFNEFGTSSLWIGGSDSQTEGDWIWDGNNDDVGIPFWMGNFTGGPVNGAYSNWGVTPIEPDNFGDQDNLVLIISRTHPNYGLWNDVASNNSNLLYYIIEYDEIISSTDHVLKDKISLYPNPVVDYINVDNKSPNKIIKIEVINNLGQLLYEDNNRHGISQVRTTHLNKGIYYLNITIESGESGQYIFTK